MQLRKIMRQQSIKSFIAQMRPLYYYKRPEPLLLLFLLELKKNPENTKLFREEK